MSLWGLNENENGTVLSIDQNISVEYVERLREIGIDQSVIIKCIKSLPFGGPKLFQIRDSVFSIEEDIASKIVVSKL